MKKHLLNLPIILTASFLALLFTLVSGSAALAAYGVGSYPGSAPSGSFPSVLTSKTIGATGGALSTSFNGYTVTLDVPPGAFASNTQVTLYNSDPTLLEGLLPSGKTFLTALAVGWSPANVAGKPLVLTITNAGITTSTVVYFTGASALTPDTNAVVSNGMAKVSFTTDPGVVLANSTTPAAIGKLGGGAGAGGSFLVLEIMGLLGLALIVGGAVIISTNKVSFKNKGL